MLREESSARAARNDTLIQNAPERALLKLADLYGLPWFVGGAVSLSGQRAFMRAALNGARSTFTGFFDILRALLSDKEIKVQATLTRTSTGVYLTGAGLGVEWGKDRLIEVVKNGGVPRLHTSLFAVTQSNELRVFVSQNKSSKHNAAHRGLVLSPVSESVTVSLLPFRILEPNQSGAHDLNRPCEVIIEVSESALVSVPAGYYRSGGAQRSTDPQGLHYVEPSSIGSLNGPYPLYYDVNGSALSVHVERALDDLLAAGVRLSSRRF